MFKSDSNIKNTYVFWNKSNEIVRLWMYFVTSQMK